MGFRCEKTQLVRPIHWWEQQVISTLVQLVPYRFRFVGCFFRMRSRNPHRFFSNVAKSKNLHENISSHRHCPFPRHDAINTPRTSFPCLNFRASCAFEGAEQEVRGEEPAEMHFFHFFGQKWGNAMFRTFYRNKMIPISNLPKSKMDFQYSAVQTAPKVLNLAVPQDFFSQVRCYFLKWSSQKKEKTSPFSKSPRVRCNVW